MGTSEKNYGVGFEKRHQDRNASREVDQVTRLAYFMQWQRPGLRRSFCQPEAIRSAIIWKHGVIVASRKRSTKCVTGSV